MSTLSPPSLPSATAATSLSPRPKDQREELAGAARQFEAIFVRQMLAEARKTNFDNGGLFSGEGVNTFRQMQDERFAEIASETGAFGLAKVLEARLAAMLPHGSAAPAGAAPAAAIAAGRKD